MNEAAARIKINRLLENAGWRFFPKKGQPANIRLEASVDITTRQLDNMGNNFEKSEKGKADFLLLDDKESPLIVLEAKSEDKDPLVGKEQARRYARELNCRFILLSNGNLHYFWDIERGNPYQITSFPTPQSVAEYSKTDPPDPQRLADEPIDKDYIALTQKADYALQAAWKNKNERPDFIQSQNLHFLRPYQLRAIHALQRAARNGQDRFLFEMATGTGKTLVSAAVVKLFLRTNNARRVLFLVDRLELEEQAHKVFANLLSPDFTSIIYKERRDDWRRAEIVVSTVQSLLFNNKFQQLFSPTDFDLVISDEAHRSIGGNARAVFNYFVGYKLGLTATPRDYLKGFDNANTPTHDPRQAERRLLLDTYRTFGCESGQPTFRYSLIDGAKDKVLINPNVVCIRTDVTTQLLSEKGFSVSFTNEESGDKHETAYASRDFEKRFFSSATNALFCKTFLQNALRDPVSNEIGKSIIFAVSQHHAARLTQTLNKMAHRMFPNKYQSDFAVQVTSQIDKAQQFAVQFANNKLLGSGNFNHQYHTSKARVCVTVGMMTTGYDCPDILNIGLFRPIFSPTDFIQIKGRGTRPHNFLHLTDNNLKDNVDEPEKKTFKLFDFFANCEYFETQYNYDQVIQLPQSTVGKSKHSDYSPTVYPDAYQYTGADHMDSIQEEQIGPKGMKIDRMFFDRFADTVRQDETIASAVESGQWDKVIDYINRKVFNKPEEYYTLNKLRKAAAVDRRLTLREILEKIFNLIPRFKSKKELLQEEFNKFIADHKPDESETIPAIEEYFKTYAASNQFRHFIDNLDIAALATNPGFSTHDYQAVPEKYRTLVPEYIKDYVSLNQFA